MAGLDPAINHPSLPGLTRQSIKKAILLEDGCAGQARA
jgi:hypothetical protein